MTIRGTDTLGAYAEQTVMIVLVPPFAFSTSETLPAATVGVACDEVFEAVGGAAPFTFALAPTSDPLPDGLTLAEDGALLGTPTSEGTFANIVRLADARTSMTTVDRSFTVTVSAAPMPDAGMDDASVGEDGGMGVDAGGGATRGGGGCGCQAAGSDQQGLAHNVLALAFGLMVVDARRRRAAR